MQDYMLCIGNCIAFSFLEPNNLSTNQGVPLLLSNKYPLSWSQELATGPYRKDRSKSTHTQFKIAFNVILQDTPKYTK